jgi:hypothetical protein
VTALRVPRISWIVVMLALAALCVLVTAVIALRDMRN